MRSTFNKLTIGFLCIFGLIIPLLGPMILPISVQAALPPRPTVTPRPTSTPIPTSTKSSAAPKPLVASLLLHIKPVQSGLWSVIQWQDVAGHWHDVEGWRGAVVNGTTIWWVEQKDFGKGPFRWLVYKNEGSPLATSQSFYLPDLRQHLLEINLSVTK